MLAGLVLAGGQSQRMGTDKSYLRLPNSQLSMLEHSKQMLSHLCEPVLVSGAQHAEGILDIHPKLGPMSGIHAAVKHISLYTPGVTGLLILPIDMPNISLNELKQLLHQGLEAKRVTSFESYNFPLYLPIDTSLMNYLDGVFTTVNTAQEPAVKHKRYALKNLINDLQGIVIKPSHCQPFENINTPQQWRQHCHVSSENHK
ncbi:MAG: molybdenum cofactor guanylyltransferase [Paraglaciecola sp.]|uniref:molybdenum cofactor guanylyltransferase n=1 Tax=Paraglaciecola sp. TaxID=1920173 RepID=UPI00329864B1